jgi:hypothetical protein
MGGLAALCNGRPVRLAIGRFLRHFKGMIATPATAPAPLTHRFCIAPMMEGLR